MGVKDAIMISIFTDEDLTGISDAIEVTVRLISVGSSRAVIARASP